jgi:rhodanese-related sulfurtransferase
MTPAAAKTVAPAEVARKLGGDIPVTLIDVRTPVEYASVHADGARLIPLDELDPGLAATVAPPAAPIYIICKSGKRAEQACNRFREAGFDNVYSVEGGTDAWINAGLPVVRNRRVISLERQVRIAAGILVLTGVILGFVVNDIFYAISAFVGCGLIFAGITDFCGMGLLLAKMPWNQSDGCGKCSV